MNLPALFPYCLHLADNALILAQRNSEWCGHGPVLEQDIAITNISLDLLGQARNYYQYAATLYNNFSDSERSELESFIPYTWKAYNREITEDDLAFLREERQYLNLLLVELPKGDWAYTVLRQFFYSAFQFSQLNSLKESQDEQLAAIAEKTLKEVAYHLRWSSEWVVRLGDGTFESRMRMKNALESVWEFTGEMFVPADYELLTASKGLGVDVSLLKDRWMFQVREVCGEANLPLPDPEAEGSKLWFQSGGKEGRHTEYMGYMLTEMQYLQRTYPDSVW